MPRIIQATTDSTYPNFAPAQEAGNAATHGLGAILAIPALVVLVVSAHARGNAWDVVAYAIFGASIFLLYLASTLYHAIRAPRAKHVLEICDHAAIFLLIAGTYTAFALTALRGPLGWRLFAIVWAIAAFGIVMEAIFLNRWPLLSLSAYLAMGWLIVFVWKDLLLTTPYPTVPLIAAGGAFYTLGTIFYVLGRRRAWFHIGWHLFVLAGTACHFFAALAALPAA